MPRLVNMCVSRGATFSSTRRGQGFIQNPAGMLDDWGERILFASRPAFPMTKTKQASTRIHRFRRLDAETRHIPYWQRSGKLQASKPSDPTPNIFPPRHNCVRSLSKQMTSCQLHRSSGRHGRKLIGSIYSYCNKCRGVDVDVFWAGKTHQAVITLLLWPRYLLGKSSGVNSKMDLNK
jgi:hypothetical protein